MRSQGASEALVDAIGTNRLQDIKIAPRDQALLNFVKLLTLKPAETRDADVQAMRTAGFTDEQIWEAAFETSLFAFLNRMADAYGLDYPSRGWLPPELRAKQAANAPDSSNGAPTGDEKKQPH